VQNDSKEWVGCDLDETLAYYDEWKGIAHIGEPIPRIVNIVKRLLGQHINVKIFTARIGHRPLSEVSIVVTAIEDWCEKHIGQVLEVTSAKDYNMLFMLEDRCIQIEPNTGRILGDDTLLRRLLGDLDNSE
jgi:hypothetical protein